MFIFGVIKQILPCLNENDYHDKLQQFRLVTSVLRVIRIITQVCYYKELSDKLKRKIVFDFAFMADNNEI